MKYLGTLDNLAERLKDVMSLEKSSYQAYDYADINVLFKLSQELNLTQIISNNQYNKADKNSLTRVLDYLTDALLHNS